MDIGVMIFPTDQAIQPVEMGREVEARGLHSLYFPEHTHIPTGRRTPWPGGRELPEEYKRTHDPFVALAAVAAATERIQLGTGIALVAQRDPIVLAKEIASLDVLSGGRFVFGIGVGWNEDEMEHHGVNPKQRRAIVREKVLAMKALWTEDEASFEGEHVRFSSSWSWPKPVQRPHPPIFMGGGGGPVTYAHIAEYCDGWMPISSREPVLPKVTDLRRAAEEAGRDPATIRLKLFGAIPKPAVLEAAAEAGVEECVMGVPPAGPDTVLPILDHYAGLLSTV